MITCQLLVWALVSFCAGSSLMSDAASLERFVGGRTQGRLLQVVEVDPQAQRPFSGLHVGENA